MNKSIKGRNSKEISIQLKRAEIKKKILTKNIYKKYEIYFQIVRDFILTTTEAGIFGLCCDLSLSDKKLNSEELKNFLNQNISLIIHSKLPLITIEQLRLGDIVDPQKQFLNLNASKPYLSLNFCTYHLRDCTIAEKNTSWLS